jgi:16S rRNA (guanine527-N7)-methyltransferase
MNTVTEAIIAHQPAFGIDLAPKVIDRLAEYYNIVMDANPLLHLVAPTAPEEFAVRHILESLMLTHYLPNGVSFADIGPGAGLPSIPCLIARTDLTARLIESKEKKCRFLIETAERLGLTERVTIINRQFEEAESGDAEIITCRALDRFVPKLPRLLKWAKGRKLILFGGPTLEKKLQELKTSYVHKLIPLSEQRYIFETL